MGVLDPSPFIDEPEQPTYGPMEAARGNLGGLQRALQRRPLAQGVNPLAYQTPEMTDPEMLMQEGRSPSMPRAGVDSPEMTRMMERAIASRIRSPEQMEGAEKVRRGALEQLVAAQRSPVDGDSTFDSYYNEAQMQMPGADGFGPAVGKAMGMVRERNQSQREAEIKALATILGFEQKEETSADSAERTAMSDTARMLAKGRSGSVASSSPFKFTKDGVFDLTQIDPETGGPKLVRKADKDYTRFIDAARRRATQLAMSPSMDGYFQDEAHRQQWIEDTASKEVSKVVGDRMTPPAEEDGNTLVSAPAAKGPINLRDAVKWAESNGNKYAVNPKSGAEGPMQVMPATQKDPGFGVTPAKDDTPEELERVGNEYLDAMIERYNGNEPVALAAYNWGPGNVDKWLKEGANPRKLPTETRQYIGDILTFRQMSGLGASPAEPAAAPVDPVTGAPAAVGEPRPLKTKAEMAREKTFAEQDEKGAGEIVGTWRSQAMQAENALNTVSNVRALRDHFEPGKFAGVRSEVGAYLDALGFKTKLGKEAKDIQSVSRMLQQEINDRMTLEKGVQTEGDAERFTKAYASIKDTPGAFDFSMGMIKEQALRKQMRIEFSEQYMKQNGSMSGIQSAWKKHNESAGPMLAPDVGGKPMWRHDWIDQTIEKTVTKFPDADEAAVRAKATEEWARRYGRK